MEKFIVVKMANKRDLKSYQVCVLVNGVYVPHEVTWYGLQPAIMRARECNETAARLAAQFNTYKY